MLNTKCLPLTFAFKNKKKEEEEKETNKQPS